MTGSMVVRTGARLHFGVLAHKRESGRRFGGAGLMIDQPGFEVAVKPSEQPVIDGPEGIRTDAERCVMRYLAHCPPDRSPPPLHIHIRRAIPQHAGFGSGTQTALAIATALARSGGDQATPALLARRVDRGQRSALGIHGFQFGGFLIDAGKRSANEIGRLAARVDFPSAWRLVLITPDDTSGLAGEAEQRALDNLPGMPASLTDRLCRIVVMHLLPAVREADFEGTGDSLYKFGRCVGEYFAPVQGGIYADPRMARLVDRLRRQGVGGVGQTSWGPTLYALAANQSAAERLVDDFGPQPECENCTLRIARPLNTAASVEFEQP